MEKIKELSDSKLRSMVEEKMRLVNEGRITAKEVEEVAKKHKALVEENQSRMNEINGLKYKIIQRLKKVVELDKYEFPITTEIKDGKLILKTENALDDFNEAMEKIDKWKNPSPVLKN